MKRDYPAASRKAAATRARMKRARKKEPKMPVTENLMTMTDEDLLKTLLDTAEHHARNVILNEKHQSLYPVFHIVAPEGSILIATPWRDDEEKNMAVWLIKGELKSRNARAYCFSSETWVAQYAQAEVLQSDELPKVMPSQHPDRKECVIMFASTRANQSMRALEMIRDGEGNLIELKPYSEMNNPEGKLSGTFPSLFDDAAQ